MVVRLGGAICVAAITFACSSVSSIGIDKEITPVPVASGPGIAGVAFPHNPYRKDDRSGGIETASSERYDPTTWTGAIHISYLADSVYSEVPPDKPADTVRDSLKDVPVGTPVEEIKRASDAFGLNFNFMKAVAKIESDFDPKQALDRTLDYSSSIITSSRSMGLEIFSMLEITLLPLPTSSLLRLYCSN
jgi:hypothetical protein